MVRTRLSVSHPRVVEVVMGQVDVTHMTSSVHHHRTREVAEETDDAGDDVGEEEAGAVRGVSVVAVGGGGSHVADPVPPARS